MAGGKEKGPQKRRLIYTKPDLTPYCLPVVATDRELDDEKLLKDWLKHLLGREGLLTVLATGSILAVIAYLEANGFIPNFSHRSVAVGSETAIINPEQLIQTLEIAVMRAPQLAGAAVVALHRLLEEAANHIGNLQFGGCARRQSIVFSPEQTDSGSRPPTLLAPTAPAFLPDAGSGGNGAFVVPPGPPPFIETPPPEDPWDKYCLGGCELSVGGMNPVEVKNVKDALLRYFGGKSGFVIGDFLVIGPNGNGAGDGVNVKNPEARVIVYSAQLPGHPPKIADGLPFLFIVPLNGGAGEPLVQQLKEQPLQDGLSYTLDPHGGRVVLTDPRDPRGQIWGVWDPEKKAFTDLVPWFLNVSQNNVIVRNAAGQQVAIIPPGGRLPVVMAEYDSSGELRVIHVDLDGHLGQIQVFRSPRMERQLFLDPLGTGGHVVSSIDWASVPAGKVAAVADELVRAAREMNNLGVSQPAMSAVQLPDKSVAIYGFSGPPGRQTAWLWYGGNWQKVEQSGATLVFDPERNTFVQKDANGNVTGIWKPDADNGKGGMESPPANSCWIDTDKLPNLGLVGEYYVNPIKLSGLSRVTAIMIVYNNPNPSFGDNSLFAKAGLLSKDNSGRYVSPEGLTLYTAVVKIDEANCNEGYVVVSTADGSKMRLLFHPKLTLAFNVPEVMGGAWFYRPPEEVLAPGRTIVVYISDISEENGGVRYLRGGYVQLLRAR